jgi:hypothetical protein
MNVITTDVERQIIPIQNSYGKWGYVIRGALPVVTAFGYPLALIAICHRVFHGDENQRLGISLLNVQRCISTVLVPVGIAAVITGTQAVQQFCRNGYAAAKRVVLESVGPGGFIADVACPGKEMEFLGKCAMEMDMQMARAYDAP